MYQLVGYGKSNPTPWHTPRETADAIVGQELRRLTAKADPARTLLIAHAPPVDTTIDKAPRLTADMKQVLSGGHMEMVSVGSAEVRKVIEEFEPVVAFHGHIHESPGVDTVIGQHGKKVPVMNPGSLYSTGVLQGIIVQLANGKVKGYTSRRGDPRPAAGAESRAVSSGLEVGGVLFHRLGHQVVDDVPQRALSLVAQVEAHLGVGRIRRVQLESPFDPDLLGHRHEGHLLWGRGGVGHFEGQLAVIVLA